MTTLIMTSGFDWWPYILVVILFLISLGVAAYATYAERKVAAFLQDRLGPNRADPLCFICINRIPLLRVFRRT